MRENILEEFTRIAYNHLYFKLYLLRNLLFEVLPNPHLVLVDSHFTFYEHSWEIRESKLLSSADDFKDCMAESGQKSPAKIHVGIGCKETPGRMHASRGY